MPESSVQLSRGADPDNGSQAVIADAARQQHQHEQQQQPDEHEHEQEPQQQQPRRKGAKAVRVRAACLRCQRRKMRCDGLLPSCKPCQHAGVSCTRTHDPETSRESKQHIARLKNRIAWLESTVQNRCPDVLMGTPPATAQSQTQDHYQQQQQPEGTSQSHCNSHAQLDTERDQDQGPDAPQPRPQSNSQHQQRLPPNNNNISPAIHTGGDGPGTSQQEGQLSPDTSPSILDHELGLVSSSAGADHRFIGASSGIFFAKFIRNIAGRRSSFVSPSTHNIDEHHLEAVTSSPTAGPSPQHTVPEIQPASLPKTFEHARGLCSTYFETVHVQFPFIHRPSFETNMKNLYSQQNQGAEKTQEESTILFQTFMVLAIASTILSRRIKVSLPTEGFSFSALEHLSHINLTGSIQGLQCTLLLLVHALNTPSLGLNMWYLHHQCVASLIDLGLHCRTPPDQTSSSHDEQLKRRAFMCTYTMDQTLSTIMGRPCSLRDEDCSCQFVHSCHIDEASDKISKLPDDNGPAEQLRPQPALSGQEAPASDLSSGIHLFQLARMTAEIKYFLHPGPSDSFSTYIKPPSVDLREWQHEMLTRLNRWYAAIPAQSFNGAYISELSEIKYHNTVMLLFRPSPAIRNPSEDALRMCYESAVSNLRIYNRLYKRNVLAYSWVTVHAVFLSSLTMLYYVWTIPDSPRKIRIDVLVSDLRAGSDVLSATGEHWPQAKQCRDALENLSNSTVRWLSQIKDRWTWVGGNAYSRSPNPNSISRERAPPAAMDPSEMSTGGGEWAARDESYPPQQGYNLGEGPFLDSSSFHIDPTQYLDMDIIASVFGGPNGDMQIDNGNAMLQGIFTDYQPTLDFLQ